MSLNKKRTYDSQAAKPKTCTERVSAQFDNNLHLALRGFSARLHPFCSYYCFSGFSFSSLPFLPCRTERPPNLEKGGHNCPPSSEGRSPHVISHGKRKQPVPLAVCHVRWWRGGMHLPRERDALSVVNPWIDARTHEAVWMPYQVPLPTTEIERVESHHPSSQGRH